MAVNELYARITQYLFSPKTWVDAKKLVAKMQQKPDGLKQVNDVFIDLVAKSLQPDVSPPFFDDFANRLVLLNTDEWEELAMTCALLPYSGKVFRSMDGYFRNAVKNAIAQHIAQGANDWQGQSKPVFIGSWVNLAQVQSGAIAAVIDACHWPQTVKEYTLLRFSDALEPANIEQLTISQVEDACKISLPNHSWLWS
jgi:hypothetical protein